MAGGRSRVEEKTDGDKANISASQPAAGTEAWIPAPDDDPLGASDLEGAACAWAKAAHQGLGEAGGGAVGRGGRLRKGREIQRVFDEGASLRGSRFLLRWVVNDVGRVRWGFAVGKKLAPTSVERNAVRRRMREAVRLVGDVAPGALDIVVVAGRGALKATVEELAADLKRALERAGAGANG